MRAHESDGDFHRLELARTCNQSQVRSWLLRAADNVNVTWKYVQIGKIVVTAKGTEKGATCRAASRGTSWRVGRRTAGCQRAWAGRSWGLWCSSPSTRIAPLLHHIMLLVHHITPLLDIMPLVHHIAPLLKHITSLWSILQPLQRIVQPLWSIVQTL